MFAIGVMAQHTPNLHSADVRLLFCYEDPQSPSRKAREECAGGGIPNNLPFDHPVHGGYVLGLLCVLAGSFGAGGLEQNGQGRHKFPEP